MAYIASGALAGLVDLTIVDNTGPGPFNLGGGGVTLGRQSFYFQTVPATDSNLGGGEFVYAKNSTANTAGAAISSITTASNTGIATVTTGSAHGLTPGAQVILIGQTPSGYSGTWVVATVPSTTTFTFVHGNLNLAATTVQGTFTFGALFPGVLVSFTNALSGGVNITSAAVAASTGNTGTTLGVAQTGLLLNQWGWFQTKGMAITNTAGAPAIGNPAYLGTAGAVTPTAAAGKQVINATYASAVSAVIGSGTSAQTLLATQALVMLNNPAVQTQIT
jgi:hypothetical protein